jgi:hypothetical protein
MLIPAVPPLKRIPHVVRAAEVLAAYVPPTVSLSDWDADLKLALLTRWNQEITEEECTRRLRTLPKSGRHDAYVISKENRRRTTDWYDSGIRNEVRPAHRTLTLAEPAQLPR